MNVKESSSTPHVALMGANGFIGAEFTRQIKQNGYKLSKISRVNCELYRPRELQKTLASIAPDFLINCAGYTGKPNVDACEMDKANCLAGNAVLPGIISEACERLEIPWGHVSSGCIFTGARQDDTGFTEADAPNFSFRQNNCSFYSGTKALGEEILSDSESCYIWRLRIPFSNVDSERNYITKLLRYDRLLEARNSLSELTEFVSAALDCFELKVPFGIYNLTNPGSVTTSEVVDIIRETLQPHRTFKFFDSEVQFMQQAASARRSNCVLDSSKAIAAGLKLTPINNAVREALRNWEPTLMPQGTQT
ncbi:sugar nucleotide-binding protein [bacterium]|nr:sugar nucleotide-binding protein [bacterium]